MKSINTNKSIDRSKIRRRAIILGFSLCALVSGVSVSAQVCDSAQVYETAWQVGSRQFAAMTEDATLARNAKLTFSEKVARVLRNIQKVRSSVALERLQMSDSRLASKIVEIAACSGNDFSIFAALLAKESKYCRDRHNRAGGDSGCGQFTTPAITEFKNQMRLGRSADYGTAKGADAFEKLVNTCYGNDEAKLKRFKERMGKRVSSVKADLRKGDDIELDLIATAVYLKFNYGFTANYYSSASKAAGALARYNGGGTSGYAKAVNGSAQKIGFCADSNQWLGELSDEACSMSDDAEVCNLLTRTQVDI